MSNNLLDLMFLQGRTYSYWLDKSVDDGILQKAYDLAKMGPTSANSCPMRIAFVKSKESKEKLRPLLDESNVRQTMAAPVTAIIAYDLTFYNNLPQLFPHTDAKSWFVGNEERTYTTAFRNSSLQGAYFILAARSLGLDCGPMSGFNNMGVDEAFFASTPIRSNFLCNLGYGDASKLHARNPRLTFDEVCKIL